jgi:hypothetical protein
MTAHRNLTLISNGDNGTYFSICQLNIKTYNSVFNFEASKFCFEHKRLKMLSQIDTVDGGETETCRSEKTTKAA